MSNSWDSLRAWLVQEFVFLLILLVTAAGVEPATVCTLLQLHSVRDGATLAFGNSHIHEGIYVK